MEADAEACPAAGGRAGRHRASQSRKWSERRGCRARTSDALDPYAARNVNSVPVAGPHRGPARGVRQDNTVNQPRALPGYQGQSPWLVGVVCAWSAFSTTPCVVWLPASLHRRGMTAECSNASERHPRRSILGRGLSDAAQGRSPDADPGDLSRRRITAAMGGVSPQPARVHRRRVGSPVLRERGPSRCARSRDDRRDA
jgi:hypothetical protein